MSVGLLRAASSAGVNAGNGMDEGVICSAVAGVSLVDAGVKVTELPGEI